MKRIFDDSWKELETVITYGFGQVGQRYMELFERQFEIKCIVDNNCKLEIWRDIPIVSQKEMLSIRKTEKIVVFASRTAYASIKKALEKEGLLENIDFCQFDTFISNWYWDIKRENTLREVHTSITTKCTFRCKKCNMFMPYFQCEYQYKLEDLKQDFELFFSRIDFVYVFSLLGGEPLLNKELSSIIQELNRCYGDKIGRIEIITNGSILPWTELMDVLRECDVTLRISDYSAQIPYRKRLNEVCDLLEKNKIDYSLESSLTWCDFIFPDESYEEVKDVRRHMLCCAPEFHGLNDGKFYYCHVAWSAEKAGLTTLKSTDYLELIALDKDDIYECRKIVEHASGNVEGGYISLCKYCMGCGSDNKNYIPVGEQMEY